MIFGIVPGQTQEVFFGLSSRPQISKPHTPKTPTIPLRTPLVVTNPRARTHIRT
jgi:hypothetical protein